MTSATDGGRPPDGAWPGPSATVEVQVLSLDPELPPPGYAHPGDAGADLRTRVDVTLQPGQRELVPTGVAIALPPGFVGLVHPRSGLAARHGLTVVNAPGTVDAGYRGEIMVTLLNTDRSVPIELRRGDRIAQLVVQRVEQARFVPVAALPDSARGTAGFGSTGGFGSAAGDCAGGESAGGESTPGTGSAGWGSPPAGTAAPVAADADGLTGPPEPSGRPAGSGHTERPVRIALPEDCGPPGQPGPSGHPERPGDGRPADSRPGHIGQAGRDAGDSPGRGDVVSQRSEVTR